MDPETRVFQGSDSEEFVIIDCIVLIGQQGVMDRHTHGRTLLPQLRQGVSIAADAL